MDVATGVATETPGEPTAGCGCDRSLYTENHINYNSPRHLSLFHYFSSDDALAFISLIQIHMTRPVQEKALSNKAAQPRKPQKIINHVRCALLSANVGQSR